MNDRLEKTIVPDPERFALVKSMWDMMLTGTFPVSKILERANHEWGYRGFLKRRY